MMAPLEELANELLDVICAHLGASDLTKLMRCSATLQRRLEPFLHSQKLRNDKAMRWACLNGVNSTVRRAASYGASVTAPEAWRTSWEWTEYVGPYAHTPRHKRKSSTTKVFTLYLATKRGHLETFKLLLSLGAKLDDDDVNVKQVTRLLNFACLEKNRSMIYLLFESGIHTKIKLVSAADWCLTRAIRNGASLDLVRLLLDCGADPNSVQAIRHQRLCPISAAIIANSELIFDLLLERGADINGKTYGCTSSMLPWNIPIFAAAQSMAKSGVGFLLKCINNGANINHTAHLFKRIRIARGSWRRDATPTPILVYIDSIKSWDEVQVLSPVEGVTFLLENGALLDPPDISHNSPHCTFDGTLVRTLLETLLEKWGLEHLTVPIFFKTVGLLSQEGISNESFIQLSLKYQSDAKGEHSDLISQRWKSLLLLFLENKETAEKSRLFVDYISEIWRRNMEADRSTGTNIRPDPLNHLGNMQLATVEALLDSGIDVNCQTDEFDGCTALHYICRYENFAESCKRSYIGCSGSSWGLPRRAQQTQEMIELLLLKGADPMFLVKGQTAFEVLMRDDEKFTTEGKEYILGLVNLMRKGTPMSEIEDRFVRQGRLKYLATQTIRLQLCLSGRYQPCSNCVSSAWLLESQP